MLQAKNDYLPQRTTINRYLENLQTIFFLKEKYGCCSIIDAPKNEALQNVWTWTLAMVKIMVNAPIPVPGDHTSKYFDWYQHVHSKIMEGFHMMNKIMVGNITPSELHSFLQHVDDKLTLFEPTDFNFSILEKPIESFTLYSRCTVPPLQPVTVSF